MHQRDLRAAIASALTDDLLEDADRWAQQATPTGRDGMPMEDRFTRQATYRRFFRERLAQRLQEAIETSPG